EAKTMKQRAFVAIEAAVASILLLSSGGCKGQGGEGPSASSTSGLASASASAKAKEKKLACAHPLAIWPSLSTDVTQYLENEAKEFQQDTSVSAKFLDVPLDELQKKFIESVPGGQGPDILIGPNEWAGVLSEGGLVADLTGKVDASKFIDVTVKAATYKGKL